MILGNKDLWFSHVDVALRQGRASMAFKSIRFAELMANQVEVLVKDYKTGFGGACSTAIRDNAHLIGNNQELVTSALNILVDVWGWGVLLNAWLLEQEEALDAPG